MTRVIKIGGRAQSDAAHAAIAAAWDAAPGSFCVVHGGGDDVSAFQRRLGAEPTFVAGRRVTTPRDLELARMVLSGAVNKRFVAALVALGVSAVGVSGEDAGLIAARVADDGALGRVGTPVRVDATLIRHLLDGRYLPVISPLSRAEDGSGALNVNADDAAAAIAVALHAEELLLLADVPAVLCDGEPVPILNSAAAAALISSGQASAGMIAKLAAAGAALAGSVLRVRIGDLGALTGCTVGTTVTRSAA